MNKKDIINIVSKFENVKENNLNNFWKFFLFNDGSMTNNLELITQSKVEIEVFNNKNQKKKINIFLIR